MAEWDIGEVVRRADVTPATLRHYETLGLVTPIGRRGLRRVYRDDVFERLALVALGRAAGFALVDIANMIANDGRVQLDRTALDAKADELDATIARLAAMRDGLRHAARCSAPSHAECPTFQRIVRAAAKGRFGPRQRKTPARR
ncbi:helix-turn-helix domain-containing protein [Dokdonella sp. MW10]|uniref:helix-turn-helix domain-containing protein n=1 Tax=Dokdonella sp. MW10 TaxID=2992926 RepID=UPI003F80116D